MKTIQDKRYSSILICSARTYQQPSGRSYWNLKTHSIHQLKMEKTRVKREEKKQMSGGDEFILIPYVGNSWQERLFEKGPRMDKNKISLLCCRVYLWSLTSKRERRIQGSGSYKNNHTHRIQTGHLTQQRHQGKSKEIRGTAETEKTRSFIKTQSAVLSGCTTVLTVWLNF